MRPLQVIGERKTKQGTRRRGATIRRHGYQRYAIVRYHSYAMTRCSAMYQRATERLYVQPGQMAAKHNAVMIHACVCDAYCMVCACRASCELYFRRMDLRQGVTSNLHDTTPILLAPDYDNGDFDDHPHKDPTYFRGICAFLRKGIFQKKKHPM